METALIPFTSAEWSTWLAQEESRLRNVYLISPGHLIAEHRREREITRGYHGREILELLQNAGDAARNSGERGRVRITVTKHGVVMGNTGLPFDKGGVESLLTANLSPKRQREAVVIGDKGLGFRSILNWTESPLVSSGELGLAFLPAYAEEILLGLESESEDLAKRVADERAFAGALIVPRLAFPQWISNWAKHPWPSETELLAVARACDVLRSEGFATAIGMPFTEQQAYEEAVRQVDELSPEFLLLVDSIGCLEIEIEGRDPKVWTCEPSGLHRTIKEGERPLSKWTVSTFEGEVPGDLLDYAEKTKNHFKLTLAVPDAGQSSPGRLFCFFPTNADLPLPLLAHATVELDETRKHVNDTRANRHILKCLAERIAELAEQQLAESGLDPWAGCRLVTPSGAWSGELKNFGFADALMKAARLKKLVPVLGGGYRTPEEAMAATGDETKWWPDRLFPEIANFGGKNERKLAIAIGVQPLSGEKIVERLLAADSLTITERAYAVAGLLPTSTQETKASIASLLCDEAGTPIPSGVSAMLQPSGELPALPDWAAIRFLHRELREQLSQLLEASDNRELQQKLKPLGVVEYSLAALIGPVLAEGNRRVREHATEDASVRAEIVEFLWRIYRATSATSKFPSEVSLKLPSQDGKWAVPGSLYLGEGYGVEGNVTQDLYAGWAKEKLIVVPDALGLEASADELAQFLVWTGVARWPREETAATINDKYLEAVKDGLRYPVDFGDCRIETRKELPWAWITDSKTVDGLDEILLHAPPEAVLAWIALDLRAAAWGQPAREHGKLTIRPPYKQYDRTYNGAVPSYTHWQISSAPWLPTSGGTKIEPRLCLLGDRQFEALFPQPKQPEAILEQRYGVSERIFDCFIRAGVIPGLGRLGHDELYRLLLNMPVLSPDGKASRALCRWFLSNEIEMLGFAGEYQKRFFEEGQTWGTRGDQAGYYKISELRHVDLDGMPPALLKKLPVADLPKRVGAEKVKRVLGIIALDRSAIGQDLTSCRPSPTHVDRAYWFDAAKPSIKRLRQAQTKQSLAMGALDRLKLVLCDELMVQMQYEGTTYDHESCEGEWFIFSDKLYVRGDLEDSINLLADSVGMAIASVFGIAEGDAFARILSCEPKNRSKLLKRMCGDDFHDEIEKAKTKPAPTYSGPIETPRPAQIEDESTPGDAPNDGQKSEEESSEGDDATDSKQPGVKQLPHVPLPPTTTRSIVIRNVQRRAAKSSGQRQMVDGEKCEIMALPFEEQNDPPRFALGVGHITGLHAPGFDLVSFESPEDRSNFQNQETRDWSKVLRFIEVKGRSSSSAKIELKGNELRAAREYGDRYFLYRFYEEADGHYLVSILENPLTAEEAKAHVIEVDLERANATQRFEFNVDNAELAEEENVAQLTSVPL